MTKFVTTRIPVDLYEKLKALAKAENRSLSSQIVQILKKATE
jgi:predicted CopG family antitoxin